MSDRERLAALERLLRHMQRRLEAQNQKMAGLDVELHGMLKDARRRLRRLEKLLGE